MNLKTVRPKNETEDFLLSLTKNCETLIKETHRKGEETLEFKLTKSRQTFHFNPSISIGDSWMLGLVSLEIYNSIFNITHENSKLELYTKTYDKFSFPYLENEVAEILDISNITSEHLQGEEIGPLTISTYRKLETETRMTDGYLIQLMGYS